MSLEQTFGEVLQSWLRSQDAATQAALQKAVETGLLYTLIGTPVSGAANDRTQPWPSGRQVPLAIANIGKQSSLGADVSCPAGATTQLLSYTATRLASYSNSYWSWFTAGALIAVPAITAAGYLSLVLEVTDSAGRYVPVYGEDVRTVTVAEAGGYVSMKTEAGNANYTDEDSITATLSLYNGLGLAVTAKYQGVQVTSLGNDPTYINVLNGPN